MRRATATFLTAVLASLLCTALGAGPAQADFGLNNFEVSFHDADGSPATQAGSHPFEMRTSFNINTKPDPTRGELPDGDIKDLIAEQIVGLVGNPTATPRCSTVDFVTGIGTERRSSCPNSTAVGAVAVHAERPTGVFDSPVYNLVPPPHVAAKLGFIVFNVPITIEAGVRNNPPYNISGTLTNIPQIAPVYSTVLRLWGNPADPAHDPFRGSCAESNAPYPEIPSRGICPTDAVKKPFLTLPRACAAPLFSTYKVFSWQGQEQEGATAKPLEMSGCTKLGFNPTISAQPTTSSAESSSGLDFSLDVSDEGIGSPTGLAQSDMSKVVTTLPEGVTVNPSSADGLDVCSEEELARETATSAPGAGCPESSKLGTVDVETPILEEEALQGSLYVAKPHANPFGTLIALYMVIKSDKLGVIVKLPGKVEPDPKTGQLVATFDELPQFPVSHFKLHFREGPRSPLVTPPRCGAYTTKVEMTPSADPAHPITTTSTFKISSGVGGGACPSGGVPPFRPGFEAGSTNNNAGSYSPFYMRLTRQDSEQDMTRFDSVLPPGVTGKIAGLAKCPDAAIEAAKARTGLEELASSSCPASSEIGHILAGAGVGQALTYVPGKIYLAGPFGGDPLSVVVITPAVAGPFDVGNVVTREALTLDPTTAEVQVDGAHSDPIPHILAGVPLKLRDLRVYIDRPNFTLNPTSCDPSAVRATLFGSFLDVFNSVDDVPVGLSDRYQAADCSMLAFRPKLSLTLKGGTKRGDHPALKSVVNYPPGGGYANIGKAVVTLPHSAFLEQSHIRTICTRVQFAAKQCPQGSIYGYAKATTPLLDETVEGPVYLRSSSHPLPDLVFALRGIVEVDVVARIDSIRGRIRATLDSVPDVPVSKFVLEMQGGKKGLVVNSRNLCPHKSKAIVKLTAQSGKVYNTNPVVTASGCRKQKSKK